MLVLMAAASVAQPIPKESDRCSCISITVRKIGQFQGVLVSSDSQCGNDKAVLRTSHVKHDQHNKTICFLIAFLGYSVAIFR